VKLDLAFEELLPHSVEAVWNALTDAAAISDWLMATTGFEPRVGARFRMETQNLSPDGWVRAEVLELDPPRRMVWAWSIDDLAVPTTVAFELTPEGGGTRLKLTHKGEIDPVAGGRIANGWPVKLEALGRSLD
jgi:uncharacterized protein YndB with AHSA1/START domain